VVPRRFPAAVHHWAFAIGFINSPNDLWIGWIQQNFSDDSRRTWQAIKFAASAKAGCSGAVLGIYGTGLINSALVGLLITDSAGNPVIAEGELPEFENLAHTGQQTSSASNGSIDVLWFLDHKQSRVLAAARINTSELFIRSVTFTVLVILHGWAGESVAKQSWKQ